MHVQTSFPPTRKAGKDQQPQASEKLKQRTADSAEPVGRPTIVPDGAPTPCGLRPLSPDGRRHGLLLSRLIVRGERGVDVAAGKKRKALILNRQSSIYYGLNINRSNELLIYNLRSLKIRGPVQPNRLHPIRTGLPGSSPERRCLPAAQIR